MRTGANLTMTIIARLFTRERLRGVTDLHINLDGARDNICYTVMWGLAYLLRCARKAGWPLQHIWLYRFLVGHTHMQLDSSFAVLARFIYGKTSGGTTACDILSFTGFVKV